MQTFTNKTIREIALESPETTRVFEDLKIDYCCGGRKLFADACSEAGLDPSEVAGKVASAIVAASASDTAFRPEAGSPSELIEYIISKHHIFTVHETERLVPLMAKVCRRHGEQHPELFELQTVFHELTNSLLPHMRKEEQVLFPYIHELELAGKGVGSAPAAHFGTVANPIRMMMSEHDGDGERLRRMREISNDYTLPEGACPSYTALFAGLQDLEKDLHRHIHLENNILFQMATELEQTVSSEASVMSFAGR